ncbi:hypothetical protein PPGU19_049790 [Paraburkholderia sp. PGU19]|nr:hypothetical protein PPGU19_049790 [Paraburkholderia sp. PGU19]
MPRDEDHSTQSRSTARGKWDSETLFRLIWITNWQDRDSVNGAFRRSEEGDLHLLAKDMKR